MAGARGEGRGGRDDDVSPQLLAPSRTHGGTACSRCCCCCCASVLRNGVRGGEPARCFARSAYFLAVAEITRTGAPSSRRCSRKMTRRCGVAALQFNTEFGSCKTVLGPEA